MADRLIPGSELDLWLIRVAKCVCVCVCHPLGTCIIGFSNDSMYQCGGKPSIVSLNGSLPWQNSIADIPPTTSAFLSASTTLRRIQKREKILESLDESHDVTARKNGSDRHGTWCHSRYHRPPAAISLQPCDRLVAKRGSITARCFKALS